MEIRETKIYAAWFARLKDERAKARINARIYRLSLGNPGDVKPVGAGVSEMRIDYGPGYRVGKNDGSRYRGRAMTIETTKWDIVDHLDSDEKIAIEPAGELAEISDAGGLFA